MDNLTPSSTSQSVAPENVAALVPHIDDENVSDTIFFGQIARPSKSIAKVVEKIVPWAIAVGIVLSIPIVAAVWIDLSAEPRFVLKNSLLYIAKIVFIYIALGAASGCAAVLFNYRELIYTLRQAEELTNVLRDEAVFQLEALRMTLDDLNKRLFHPAEDPHHNNMAELVKSAMPVVMLLINKEQSVLRWGMVGLKVAREAMDFFKGTSKDK